MRRWVARIGLGASLTVIAIVGGFSSRASAGQTAPSRSKTVVELLLRQPWRAQQLRQEANARGIATNDLRHHYTGEHSPQPAAVDSIWLRDTFRLNRAYAGVCLGLIAPLVESHEQSLILPQQAHLAAAEFRLSRIRMWLAQDQPQASLVHTLALIDQSLHIPRNVRTHARTNIVEIPSMTAWQRADARRYFLDSLRITLETASGLLRAEVPSRPADVSAAAVESLCRERCTPVGSVATSRSPSSREMALELSAWLLDDVEPWMRQVFKRRKNSLPPDLARNAMRYLDRARELHDAIVEQDRQHQTMRSVSSQ